MIPLVSFVVVIALAAMMIVLTALRKQPASPADRDWMESFSVAKYRPMERLLGERDFAFLASQPGYHPSIGRKLRRERRRIFGSYLRCLIGDFYRLYAAASLVAVSASEDRADFSAVLVRKKFAFQATVLAVKGRLLLYSFGIGTVDIGGLLAAVGSMSVEVKRLQPLKQL